VEKRLSDLRPGERAVIVRVAVSGYVRKRLLDMGLVKGTEVVMLREAPLGDPIEFELKGYNLSLRKREAERIFVEAKGVGSHPGRGRSSRGAWRGG